MASVDEFVLFDEAQYTRRDWRNRNRFKTPHGVRWLTIPVRVAGRYVQRIDETVVSDRRWAERHWSALRSWYGRAPWFDHYASTFAEIYAGMTEPYLSRINRTFLETIRDLLGVATPLRWSSQYSSSGRKTDRLITLCQSAQATCYVSGPTARAYLDEAAMWQAGIELRWMDYSNYPEYPQLYPPFDPHVSIMDLLFSIGTDARSYLRHPVAS